MPLLRWAAVLLVCAAAGVLLRADGPARAEVTFQCTWTGACPEIMVAGDPFATLAGGPSPFRGYGDPSLELDPATGTIWMSYSWLEVLVSSPGPPPVPDFGVETHLARSDDGGQTFTFVRKLNDNEVIQHSNTGQSGWTSHEVSTIVKRGADWETLWLTYFDPFGSPGFYDFYYDRSLGATPNQLGDSVQPWADGWLTSPSFGAAHDLSEIPQLSDCAVPTEPALLYHGGVTYLATNCVVIVDGQRRPDLERLVLLRETANGYEYVGVLLDYQDAVDNGGERIEQADLMIAQNGAILLIATPIEVSEPNHLGCKVFEVTDLATAQVRRDQGGEATVLASITGDDPTLGAGLCTYDAASSTGIVMILHQYTANPFDMLFSMRATGVHPEGVDTDGDGLADTADNCPQWANPLQDLPNWVVPAGDSDCDGYPDTVAAAPRAPEIVLTTVASSKCSATTASNDEPFPDAWPPDFNDNQLVNGADILSFNSRFGSSSSGGLPYSVRFDLNASGLINGADVLQLNAFFGKRCSP